MGSMAAEFIFLFQLRPMPVHTADCDHKTKLWQAKIHLPLRNFSYETKFGEKALEHWRRVRFGDLTSDPLISEQKHVGSDSAPPRSPPLSQSHCPLSFPHKLWPRGHPDSVSAWSASWRGSTQTCRALNMCE